jgi:hypothetical protein
VRSTRAGFFGGCLLPAVFSLLSCGAPGGAPVGAFYLDSLVFGGLDAEGEPVVAAFFLQRSQAGRDRVEIETKLFFGRGGGFSLVASPRASATGRAAALAAATGFSFTRASCAGDKECISVRFGGPPVITLALEAPPLALRDALGRRGEALGSAVLTVEGERISGFGVLERLVAPDGPPGAGRGVYDRVILFDGRGAFSLSSSSRVGDFALAPGSLPGATALIEPRDFMRDPKSRRVLPESWYLAAPDLSLEGEIRAVAGHQSRGPVCPSGLLSFFGHGFASGEVTVSGERREVFGYYEHYEDN